MSIGLLGFVLAHTNCRLLGYRFLGCSVLRTQSERGCINGSSLRSFIEPLIHPLSLRFVLAFTLLRAQGLELYQYACLISQRPLACLQLLSVRHHPHLLGLGQSPNLLLL